MGTFNNNNYAGNNSSKKYLDANNDQSTNYDDLGSTFGAIFGGPLGAVAGNLAGQGINYLTSNKMAEDQFERQKELQKRANDINMQNAGRMAQIQVTGMQNAGMNPAGTQFTSAPTQQQGAAPMPTVPHLGNIFQGVAELIAAAKAPTEIEKMIADTSLTKAKTSESEAQTGKIGAETENITYDYTTMKPEQVKKMEKDIEKLNEDIQNTRNVNEIYQTKSDFIRTHAPSIFTGWRDQLKSTNNWNKLPEKTRQTIDSLANGDIEMDVGSIEGLNQIIKTQTDLSEADKNVMQNLVNTSVALKQLKNNKILDKIAKMPDAQYNKLYKEMKLLDERTTNQQIKNWSDIVNDKNFMVTKELYDELLKIEGLEQAEETMNDLHSILKSWASRPGSNTNGRKGKVTTKKSGNNAKYGAYSETTVTDYGL